MEKYEPCLKFRRCTSCRNLIRLLRYHRALYCWDLTGCTKRIHYVRTTFDNLFSLHGSCYRLITSQTRQIEPLTMLSKMRIWETLDVGPVCVLTPRQIYISVAAGKYESEVEGAAVTLRSRSVCLFVETLNWQTPSLISQTGSNPFNSPSAGC